MNYLCSQDEKKQHKTSLAIIPLKINAHSRERGATFAQFSTPSLFMPNSHVCACHTSSPILFTNTGFYTTEQWFKKKIGSQEEGIPIQASCMSSRTPSHHEADRWEFGGSHRTASARSWGQGACSKAQRQLQTASPRIRTCNPSITPNTNLMSYTPPHKVGNYTCECG